MPEEKKQVPAAGKDLSSKIAAAYRSIPPEEREKTLHGDQDVQNPELDVTFDKLVETYRTKRGEKSVVPFPRSASPLARESDDFPEGEGYECAECGHMNPTANQFCGMCGAARDESTAVTVQRTVEESATTGLDTEESRVRHHHHYYHHHHYRNNPYLLLAVVLLLAIIAWQEYREYRRAPLSPATSPAVQAQPDIAAPTPAAEAKPAANAPASTPAKPLATPKPSATPKPLVRQESPPSQVTRTPVPSPTVTAPPESTFRKLLNSVMPTLAPPSSALPSSPAPTATPNQPPTATPQRVRISQGVSEGRVTRRVAPEYPLMAARSRIKGPVELEAVIDGEGNVKNLTVVSGNPLLADAATKAVKQWKYQPYLLDGQPVEVATRITVVFK